MIFMQCPVCGEPLQNDWCELCREEFSATLKTMVEHTHIGDMITPHTDLPPKVISFRRYGKLHVYALQVVKDQ